MSPNLSEATRLEDMMKRSALTVIVLILSTVSVAACKHEPMVQVITRCAPIRGANGLYFDKSDRLHIGSVFGREVIVMDPSNGKILDRIGPDRGVDVPDTDVATPMNAIRFQGDLVVAEMGTESARVIRISKENRAIRTTLAELKAPVGLAATRQDLWATDWEMGTVVQIIKDGQRLTPPKVVASGLKGPEGMAVAPDGSLLVVVNLAGRLSSLSPETGAINSVAEQLELGIPGPPNNPIWILDSVAVGPSGAIYVGGDKANVVYRIQ
jgi:DNA-binding beta-propeller fold protein YncE